jgi:hypothetical protein
MGEDLLAIGHGDEAKALGGVEEFDGSLRRHDFEFVSF